MTNPTINEIAAKHLGKTSDGATMQAYVTPDAIDSSLLVAIPRELNRTQYGIEDSNLPFYGYDVWNCYEVSCMTSKGLPVSILVKIQYSSSSKYIVESKSLKLYLNSFNMVKMASDRPSVCIFAVAETIKKDLSKCLETAVEVCAENASVTNSTDMLTVDYLDKEFIEKLKISWKKSPALYENFSANLVTINRMESEEWTIGNLEITEYNENPDILELDGSSNQAFYTSSLLRSNCRVTNQPDWGDIFIFIEGEKIVTRSSMLAYIISMRNENHFHEEICECVYKRLLDKLNPDRLVVGCLYTRRGGIDINPVRSKIKSDLGIFNIENILSSRTSRQ